MSIVKLRMAARCEAAGRPDNEDNFQLSDNLSGDQWGFITDRTVTLSEKGALLVICDGMGGMNAGAEAADIAVKTIKEWFAAERLTPQIITEPETISQYIANAIIDADEKIKESAQQNSEQEGMGSTIVLAWIVDKNVHIGWCGDSRAYRFNPVYGLERLSHDHSYVQDLVDSGKLSEELAFDHPDNNIITRSLGDTRIKVEPEVKGFPLCDGDIILLCSDGLSSVLRDKEIESVMSANVDAMENCREALWTASEKAGWTDNVTIALCQIVSGGKILKKKSGSTPEEKIAKEKKNKRLIPAIFIIIAIILLLGIAFEMGYYVSERKFWLPSFASNEKLPEQASENDNATPETQPDAASTNPTPQNVSTDSQKPKPDTKTESGTKTQTNNIVDSLSAETSNEVNKDTLEAKTEKDINGVKPDSNQVIIVDDKNKSGDVVTDSPQVKGPNKQTVITPAPPKNVSGSKQRPQRGRNPKMNN